MFTVEFFFKVQVHSPRELGAQRFRQDRDGKGTVVGERYGTLPRRQRGCLE